MTLTELKSELQKRSAWRGKNARRLPVTTRCVSFWITGDRRNPLTEAARLLKLARSFCPGVSQVSTTLDGEEVVVIRKADLEALTAPAPVPLRLTHKQLIAIRQRRN